MKKGFTMIELIFVIVILGILAAVAIPRLAATRDDAEVAKAGTNISTLISDLGAYYTSQGTFASKISDMTNVAIVNESGRDLSGGTLDAPAVATAVIQAAGKNCLNITVTTEQSTATKKTPAYITIAAGGDSTTTVCGKVLADPSVATLVNSEFFGQTGTEGADGAATTWAKDAAPTKGVPLIGLSVVR